MEEKNHIYVLTGGPGFGKSTLIRSLGERGCMVGNEVARDIIREQRLIGGDILPEKNVGLFQKEVLKRRIAFYKSVDPSRIAFVDRAIPDQIAFARFKGFGTPDVLMRRVVEYRYNKTVFVTPPWKEIYKNDGERLESYEEACELHQILLDVYLEFGYLLIDIPLFDIEERTDFVLNIIHEKNEY